MYIFYDLARKKTDFWLAFILVQQSGTETRCDNDNYPKTCNIH